MLIRYIVYKYVYSIGIYYTLYVGDQNFALNLETAAKQNLIYQWWGRFSDNCNAKTKQKLLYQYTYIVLDFVDKSARFRLIRVIFKNGVQWFSSNRFHLSPVHVQENTGGRLQQEERQQEHCVLKRRRGVSIVIVREVYVINIICLYYRI